MLRCRNYLHFPYILRYVVQLTQVRRIRKCFDGIVWATHTHTFSKRSGVKGNDHIKSLVKSELNSITPMKGSLKFVQEKDAYTYCPHFSKGAGPF